MKTRSFPSTGLLILWLACPLAAQAGEECTSAVVAPAASAAGVPILWKNRDTGVLSNKIIFVKDEPLSYLGLANAEVPNGRQVFAGLNAAGFAIMNTVAYNLPKRAGEMVDLEGIAMADALRTCRSVEDFERYLRAGLGPALGCWANFGVIDAAGKAFLFEVHNHGFEKRDAAAAERGYLVNTNFARSGAPGRGEGYLRFERATQLFAAFEPGAIDVRGILGRCARDVGHALLEQPTPEDARNLPPGRARWIYTGDCIDRPSTAAAVVIAGRKPGDRDSVATLWVIPGEPLSAIAVPLWVEAGRSPAALWKGVEAPMWRQSLRIKRILRPRSEGHQESYLDLTRLANAAGSGVLAAIERAEEGIFKDTQTFLEQRHSAGEYSAFQDAQAERALAALRAIRDPAPARGTSAQEAPRPLRGALVIAGGGRLPDEVRATFLELAGGKAARLVVIPTASARADEDLEPFLAPWRAFEPASLCALHTRSRAVAEGEEFVAPLRAATAVWISGGQQDRLLKAYGGTALERALHALIARGGVVGGTSAGAACLSPVMIAGGNPVPRITRGFGLFPGAIIDQHFLRRNRLQRLVAAIRAHPGHVGYGIDEGTALVVQGDRLRAIGTSYALVYLAATRTHPPRITALRAGDQRDWIALLREARAR